MVYFPSCNFTSMDPEAARLLNDYLVNQKGFRAAGCCRTDKTDCKDEPCLYFCQACRGVLSPDHVLQNLYVFLAEDDSFPWPDLTGLQVCIQDCWRDRDHPEIMQAVRRMLEKMHITWTETGESMDKTVYCGDLHFEPARETGIRLMEQYPGVELKDLPDEVKHAILMEQAEKYTGQTVVTYCNRCTKLLRECGCSAHHILSLAFQTCKLHKEG